MAKVEGPGNFSHTHTQTLLLYFVKSLQKTAFNRDTLHILHVSYVQIQISLLDTQGKDSPKQDQFSSVQFSHSVVSDSLRPLGLQLTRLPCPLLIPGTYSNSCPLSWWCHPTISSLSCSSPPALNIFQHQGVFQWVSYSHQVDKVLEFKLQH